MSYEIKKILITGSNGSIGTRLMEKLLDEGYDVTGVDIRKNHWNKRLEEHTIKLDLTDLEQVMTLDKDFDLIIHLAAHPYVFKSVENPKLAHDNFVLLFNLLEFARLNDIKKFMFASSREVYGNSGKEIHTEEDSFVKNCESPYTATKIGGEALVHAYTKSYDIEHIIFRFSNVYGMYDESHRLVPNLIRKAKRGDQLIVYGKDKLLDFTYIDDLMDGLLACIQKFDTVRNNTFNLSGGQPTSILKVAELIKKNYESSSDILIKDSRPGEVIRYVADLTKAGQFLNYFPTTTIDEGIKKSIDWYEEHGNFDKE